MLREDEQARPLPAELATIKLSAPLIDQLNQSYVWVNVEGQPPFASLIAPVGRNETGLYHFIDNATLNHHNLNRYANRTVTPADVLAAFTDADVRPVAFQLLGGYLMQLSKTEGQLLPLMEVLALAGYDSIGVFAAMLTSETVDLKTTLIEMSARLLAQLPTQMATIDHVPDDTDFVLPPHLIIAVEDDQGQVTNVPVALLDWLPNHHTALTELADGDRLGLVTYLNQQTDDDSAVLRDWLLRRDENAETFSQWIFQHR